VAVAKLTDKDRRSEFARLLSFRLGTRGIAEQLSPLKTGFCSRIPSLTEYDHETGTNAAERRLTARHRVVVPAVCDRWVVPLGEGESRVDAPGRLPRRFSVASES
jgi:hypothetical protein